MNNKSVIRIIWHGDKTVLALKALAGKTAEIEIRLPNNFNHALYSVLSDHNRSDQLEIIDANGGPELLELLANIDGLESFAQLDAAQKNSIDSVRIHSPPTITIGFTPDVAAAS